MTRFAQTSNGSTIHYWHGLDVIAQSDGTQTEYMAYDGLGSVRQVTDSAGLVEMAQTFDPYGNLYSRSGVNSTTYGFTGEAQDDNGLLFLRARYYSAGMGRFLNTDPSRQEQNAFAYAMGNPVMFSDPSGLDSSTPSYNKTVAPAGIRFDPTVVVGSALGIDANTGVAFEQWKENNKQGDLPIPAQFQQNSNFTCGVVALAMILGTDANQVLIKALISMKLLDPNNVSNPDALRAAIEQWGPITGDDIVKIVSENYADQIGGEASYVPLFRQGTWNNETDKPVTLQESQTGNLNWLFLLRRTIAQQKYPLVLLDIVGSSTPDNRGMLIPAGTGAKHWLVVTGVTSWDQWMQGTEYQWVMVANPFENETEYYPWNTFIGSVENLDPNLVIVSKK